MTRSFHQGRHFGKFATLAGVFGSIACGAGSPTSASNAPTVRITEPRAELADEEPLEESTDCTPRVRTPRAIRPVADVAVSPDDPMHGRFTLEMAIRGLSGSWPLSAEIETDHGTLDCELWDQSAPITVANFVGLARGLRPFRDPTAGDRWRTRPAYDGSSFHRTIAGFMIQGGDPAGTGAGDGGYVIPDEIDESIQADRRGILYMANRGANTNSLQFFILDGSAPHIAGRYTAFGECGPSDVIETIAKLPAYGERPERPPRIRRVRIALAPGCG